RPAPRAGRRNVSLGQIEYFEESSARCSGSRLVRALIPAGLRLATNRRPDRAQTYPKSQRRIAQSRTIGGSIRPHAVDNSRRKHVDGFCRTGSKLSVSQLKRGLGADSRRVLTSGHATLLLVRATNTGATCPQRPPAPR